MTFAQTVCGAALLVSAAAGAAAPESPARAGNQRLAGIGPAKASVRLEYTDFSKLYGDRTVLTMDSRLGIGRYTRLTFSASEGQRRVAAARSRGAQGAASVDHDWSDRLSTHTSLGVATNGAIFAKWLVGQDVSYKITDSLVGTAGARYSSYGNGNEVATWSVGAAYYLPGLTFNYRYSLLASRKFGRSQAHLASLRLNDRGGSGSTQLWVGHGTSLYEVDLPRSANGRFTSVALQRSQPISGGVHLTLGVNRAWYKTPSANYRGTGFIAGLSFSKLPL
jgi:YaiO family outer membrane protein